MKVINIHSRVISQPKSSIEKLFRTLASANDLLLATDKWSPMQLDQGLQVGSKGGHGPIGYTVRKYIPDNLIEFEFTKPAGFHGIHKFEIRAMGPDATLMSHTIDMQTRGAATFLWLFAIRWLHDAYIEDAFDKVENHFSEAKKQSQWSVWVKLLRKIGRAVSRK